MSLLLDRCKRDKGAAGATDQHSKNGFRRVVGIPKLIAICFFLVSAGPYGMEAAIGAGGARWTIALVFVIPFIFSLPMALMSSELATLFPLCGGPIEWLIDLGQVPSRMNSYWRFLRFWIDNSLYPATVLDYLANLSPVFNNTWVRFGITFFCYTLTVLLNCFGLEIVGALSIVLTAVILAPFVLYVGFSLPLLTAKNTFAPPPPLKEINWSVLLSTLIWQFSGFDTIAAVAEEVYKPQRTYPVGLTVTVAIVTITYLLPTITGVNLNQDLDFWRNGSFGASASLLPHCHSGWLSWWISLGGAISSLSILNVAIGCTGRDTYAMAKTDALPFSKFFSKLSYTKKHKDALPRRAFILIAILCLPLSFFSFDILVSVDGLLTCLVFVFQVAAYFYARYGRNGATKRMQRCPVRIKDTLGHNSPGLERPRGQGKQPHDPVRFRCSESGSRPADETPSGSSTNPANTKIITPQDKQGAQDGYAAACPRGAAPDHGPFPTVADAADADALEATAGTAGTAGVGAAAAAATAPPDREFDAPGHGPETPEEAITVVHEALSEVTDRRFDAEPWVVSHEDALQASPDAQPFRVPGGLAGAIFLSVPPLLVVVAMVCVSGWEAIVFSICFLPFVFALKHAETAITACVERRRAARSSRRAEDATEEMRAHKVIGSDSLSLDQSITERAGFPEADGTLLLLDKNDEENFVVAQSPCTAKEPG